MKFGLSCDRSGVKFGLSCDRSGVKFGLSCDRSGVKSGISSILTYLPDPRLFNRVLSNAELPSVPTRSFK